MTDPKSAPNEESDPPQIAYALQRVLRAIVAGDWADVEPSISGLNLTETGTVVGNLAHAFVLAQRELGVSDAETLAGMEAIVARTVEVDVERGLNDFD